MSRIIEIVIFQVKVELKSEMRRNYLGLIWWILEPLIYMVGFFLVFAVGLRRGGEDFVFFLLTGLTAWKWFASTVTGSTGVMGRNRNLINQISIPKYLFPLNLALTNTVKYFFVLSILLVALVSTGHSLHLSWLALPLVILVQFAFLCACAGIISAVVPFLPDLGILVNTMMTLLFFMSGIFYDIKSIQSGLVKSVLRLNPLVTIFDAFRDVLLRNEWPDFAPLFVILGVSVFGIWAAVWLFGRLDKLYPRYL